MNQPWYDRFLDKIVLFCRGLLLVFLAVVMVQSLTAWPDAEFLTKTQSKEMRALLVMAMTVFLFLLFWGIRYVLEKAGQKILRLICIIAPCIIVAGQLVFLLYYRSLYMWDSAYIVGGASALLEEGAVAKEAFYYYSVYPNQNAFAVLTEGILWLARLLGLSGGDSLLLCNVINMIALDLSIVFGLLLWHRYKPDFSGENWAFLWIVLMFQPFFYIGVSYYYTITLSLPFMMAFLYLVFVLFAPREVEREYTYEHIKDHGTIRHIIWVVSLSVLAGICFAIGFLIRATMIIPFIAAVFCAVLAPRFKEAVVVDKKRGRKILISLIITVCGVLVILGAKHCMEKEIGIDTTDTAFPATHWVMMSLTSPGCHNEEDEAYTAGFPTAGEKRDAVFERMKEKLTDLGGTGYFLLVLDKIRNTWASGANSYVLFMENCLRMDGIYPYLFGNHKDFMILYQQGMHFLVLLGIVLSVLCQFGKKDNPERESFLLQLVLLGGFLFYVLWETSGQYSLPFFIIMLLLSMDGYERAAEKREETSLTVQFMQDQSRQLIKQKERVFYKIMAACGGICLVIVFVFFVKNTALFTRQTDSYKAPAVNQLIANTETDYAGEDTISQSFRTKNSFNELIFQWRNPLGEENSAQYEITLSDSEGHVYWTKELAGKNQGYAGAFLYDFDTIQPQKEQEFVLSLTKTGGEEDDYLQFVTYSCGSYDPYPFGSLTIAGKEQSGDLLLQASLVEDKSYTTTARYVIFAGVCMSIFLFFEICCILQLYALVSKERHNTENE